MRKAIFGPTDLLQILEDFSIFVTEFVIFLKTSK